MEDEKEINWYKIEFKWRFCVEQFGKTSQWFERTKFVVGESEEDAKLSLYLPKPVFEHIVLSCKKLENADLEKYRLEIQNEMKGIYESTGV